MSKDKWKAKVHSKVKLSAITTLLVLTFAGINFRGDKLSRSPRAKINFRGYKLSRMVPFRNFAGINFRDRMKFW